MLRSMNGKLGKNGCHHIIICITYACVSCYTYMYFVFYILHIIRQLFILRRSSLYVICEWGLLHIWHYIAYNVWCITFYHLHTLDISPKSKGKKKKILSTAAKQIRLYGRREATNNSTTKWEAKHCDRD